MKPAPLDPEFSRASPTKSVSGSSRALGLILLGLLLPFMALTYLAVRSGSPGSVNDRPVLLTTLATITGPFVGSIARHNQSCCLSVSLALAGYSGPFLAIGLLAQMIPFPRRQYLVRLVFWAIGWLIWLLAGQVSFMHALF